MPRRTSAQTLNVPLHPGHPPSLALDNSLPSLPPNLIELRRHWKWAAFSQFFFTFNSLFAMDDVTLTNIEDDLINSTDIYLPRVMQRLLYTLSQDRKISLDNWQTVLRRQYYRRDPAANPIGPHPIPEAPYTRDVSAAPRAPSVDASVDQLADGSQDLLGASSSRIGTPTAGSTLETWQGTPEQQPTALIEEEAEEAPAVALLSPDQGQVESKNWLDLPMLAKLESIHHVIEWHFHNPLRLRAIMRNDDEDAQWRIEPIGYDSKRNAYWLIGADRLWIQREIPKPPKSLKRKRPGAAGNRSSKASRSAKTDHSDHPSKRRRSDRENVDDKAITDSVVTSNSQHQAAQPLRGRAAKAQANLKLDAQAKALAAFRSEEAAAAAKRGKPLPPSSTRPPLGTRLSARLRGDSADGEWQPIPEEWLGLSNPDDKASVTPVGKGPLKTGLESDLESTSDLTELSESSDEDVKKEDAEDVEKSSPTNIEASVMKDPKPATMAKEDDTEFTIVRDRDLDNILTPPEGFIEWETICVTLVEWEHIAERFEKSVHYSEKALYRALKETIVPVVTEELREAERKRRLEDAVVHRKRSSRIAMKESEKEEARLIARRKAEDDEKLARARRHQARLEKEEADRAKREMAREQRKKEREAKEQKGQSTDGIDIIGNGASIHGYGATALANAINGNSRSGSRTPAGDDWELDCEICQKHGINLDDGSSIMCCSYCSKWQHISCHDAADARAGRPKRDWDVEDFICRRCRAQKSQPPNNTFYGHDAQLSQRPPPNPTNYLPSRQYYYQPGYVANSVTPNSANMYPPAVNGDTQPRLPNTQDITVQPRRPITFTHYQPQQHGFSSPSTQLPQYGNYSHPSQPYTSVASNGAPYSSQRPGPPLSTEAHPQGHWPNLAPAHAYPSYGTNAGQRAGYSPIPGYRQQKANGDPAPQWQPNHALAHPSNQFPQFRYHQAMGPTTSYQP